jgi:hypothetical protein
MLIVAVTVAAASAMMVAPTTTATPHHRTANETETATETGSMTRMRMRTERLIHRLVTPARTRRTRTRISRTPKRVESARRGVLRLVQGTGVGDMRMREVMGRGIMPLGAGGVLDKTRGCIQMSGRRVLKSVIFEEHGAQGPCKFN